MEVNIIHFNVVVSAFGREARWQRAQQLVKLGLGGPGGTGLSVVSCNAVATAAGRAAAWPAALQLLTRLSDLTLQPTAVSYNAGNAGNAGHWRQESTAKGPFWGKSSVDAFVDSSISV